ncbi:glycosyltransferase family 4 protein [Dehalobacter sp. DCM]|uniref:glycosyltransferase family 4 protein n=1 Tax=Dehalobacter sp. DCM TaxID=2907827 RepID=UPI00308124A4|nr:glycosyltransferase family 4 protein [Dehalobacter sp. DCM]
MTINVLHLIGGGEIGGAEQNVFNLVRNLDREKVNPHLGCLIKGSPFAALARSQGIATDIFPMRFPFDLLPVPAIAAYCRKHNIRLIHAHGTRANLLGRTTAGRLKIPCISTIHSLPEFDYLSTLKGRISLALDDVTLRSSAGLIAVSDSLRESMSRRLQRKRLPIPLKTIYNGIEALDFSQAAEMGEQFRKTWGIPPQSVVIGTIGRLHPVKGQNRLVEAITVLNKEYKDLHLVIIGEGPLYDSLQEQLDASGISYTLTGFLPNAWKALPAMNIFVLPSLNEGMGLVLLEAAQAGIPIIASDVGGIPELLSNYAEAILIKPGEHLDIALACSLLLKNNGLIRKLTDNARKRAMAFTVERMVESTTAFYVHVTSQ